MSFLPDFKLETYFSRWEFNTKYNLCASDTESLSLEYLLDLSDDKDKKSLEEIKFGYLETYGSTELREAISSTYNNSSYKDILTFAGAEEGIYVAMKSILSKKDHAIVITPNYQSAQTLPTSICDVTAINLDSENNWNLDIQKIKDSLQPNTLLISINFPHNPTGKVISKSELNDIVNISRENNLYLFSDEIYRLMERDENKRLDQISDIYDKGISLNGMSKTYGMPGIRIGWISCKDHSLLDKMEKLKHYLSICNSTPNEKLSIIALKYRSKIIERSRKIIKNNLVKLNSFFQKYDNLFEWKEPDGGCIGFPKYNGPEGVEVFCENLIKEKSVLLLPSSVYNSNLINSPNNHFRIGYGRLNMPEGLSQLKNFIDKN